MDASRGDRQLCAQRRQGGLSLVELMVAIALGAFITVGIIQMFSANQETYQVNIGQARMQENARFAMEFLTTPLRMAGFSGCYSDEGGIHEAIALVAGNPPFEADFASGAIAGNEATAPAVWSPGGPTPAPLPADVPAATIVGGTDVLVVRLADPVGTRLAQPMAANTDPVVVREPDDAAAYGTGTIMVISDCRKGAVFQSTGSAVAGGQITIQHVAGAAGVNPGNGVQALSADGSTYDVDATVHALQTSIFYIAPGAGTNNRGDNPLSLWRKFGTQAPAELVEGVEDLQVLYGVDTDNDNVPNRYVTFQNVADLADVVTMRVSITANSVDVVNDVGDGLIRRTFTNTIALRHRIGG
jgi:type IV pilus assembly protein PilW